MHFRSKLALAALAAGLTMLFTVGTATANRLSVSDRNIDVSWAALTFTPSTGTEPVRCPVTLLGSFHSSTIAKVARALIGHMTHAVVRDASCTGGRAQPRTETLPWHITYERFAGRLPAITSITTLLLNATFLIQQTILGATANCVGRTTSAENARGIINLDAMGTATSLNAESDNIQTDDFGESILCDNFFGADVDGRFSGLGDVTNLSGARVTVRLI